MWKISRFGEGRQFQVSGPEPRIGYRLGRSTEVSCGGLRKRLARCRRRGIVGQRGHFHGQAFDLAAECGTGFRKQPGLRQPDAQGPGRAGRQEHEASVTEIREPRLAGDGGGQEMAQAAIQGIEGAGTVCQRTEGKAVRDGFRAARAVPGRTMARRHHEHEPGGIPDMNIIIVPDTRSAPRCLDLGRLRVRLALGAVCAVFALSFLAVGAAAGGWLAGHGQQELRQVSRLRAVLAGQRAQLAAFEREGRHGLDALALQLGQLQAQATRLNALGERLTQVGKLDDGEFDFSAPPPLGGPETPSSGSGMALPFQEALDDLRTAFDQQASQLELLEGLLRDREIDKALLPSGMPVAQGYISSGFGGRADPLNGHSGVHLGVDFGAPSGSPILAVADGLVTFAGVRNGYGNVIEIDHGNGYVTRYAHASALIARAGQRVRTGEAIARVGSTGRSTGPHCHFEVWRDGRAVNPMAYVRAQKPQRG